MARRGGDGSGGLAADDDGGGGDDDDGDGDDDKDGTTDDEVGDLGPFSFVIYQQGYITLIFFIRTLHTRSVPEQVAFYAALRSFIQPQLEMLSSDLSDYYNMRNKRAAQAEEESRYVRAGGVVCVCVCVCVCVSG